MFPPIKPMKAPSESLVPELFGEIQYPVLATPKLDGIRATVQGGRLLTNTLKLIPNQHTRSLFEHSAFEGLDGELVVGSSHGEGVFHRTSSGVMSRDGTPPVTFYVFDTLRAELRYRPYADRLQFVEQQAKGLRGVVVWYPTTLHSPTELRRYVSGCLEAGYEGAMLRLAPTRGHYKEGRTTVLDNLILKIKPDEELEGTIIGFDEAMENLNPPVLQADGRNKRSSAAAGLVPKGTLGTLLLQTREFGIVRCSPGTMTATQRLHVWQNQAEHMGMLVTAVFQRTGTKDAPRTCRFKRFRPKLDMSPE